MKLEMMKTLQKGWNSYKAEAPSLNVIERVRRFIPLLCDPDRVEPSAMGGIGVTYCNNNKKAYVEFYNNNNIAVLLTDDVFMNVVQSIEFPKIIEVVSNYLELSTN